MAKGVQFGDVLKGIVLEMKEDNAVIKLENKARPIEARVLADLEVGDKITVKVKGWFNGELVLKVIEDNNQGINFKA